MSCRALIGILLFLVSFASSSQNLIRNPSFEIFNKGQTGRSLKRSAYWYNVSSATPDIHHPDNGRSFGVPKNYGGYQEPHSGKAYAGIILFDQHRKGGYVEYIGIKLSQPLFIDSLYCLRFFVSLRDYSGIASNGLGIFLSKRKIKKLFSKSLLNLEPVISNILPDDSIEVTDRWVEVSALIKPTKRYKYLAIGSADLGNARKIITRESPNFRIKYDSHAFYYLDDFSLEQVRDSSECICEQKAKTPIADTKNIKSPADTFKTIILKDIYFETGEWKLLKTSYNALNQLADYLQENDSLNVEISGHTDNIGSEKDNQALSENRAKAVVNYLISKGIREERLTFKGYGSIQPIASNKTEEGRAKNRRVEMKVIE